MKTKKYCIPLLCVMFVLVNASIAFPAASARIIVPQAIPAGREFPVIGHAISPDGGIDDSFDGASVVRFVSDSSVACDVHFRKGVAYCFARLDDAGAWNVSVEGLPGAASVTTVNSPGMRSHSADIDANDEIWRADEWHSVENTIVVPEGSELTIEAGTVVQLGPDVSIIVNGTITVIGDDDAPVLFMSASDNATWGGVEIRNGHGDFRNCLFTRGGGDRTREFGHSDSQPVVYVDHGTLQLLDCGIVFNAGKGIGATESVISVESCLIAQCDTGGEVLRGRIHLASCHIMDIPDDGDEPRNDDNDGFYFSGVYSLSDEPSTVRDTVVINTKDDGFDHNGACLEITDSWIENCDNEGLASSNANYAIITNTVVKNCGQGIEAGYGSPDVTVDHCVVVENGVGLRFGDSYDWGCSGHMTVKNTVVHGNDDNIRNYDRKTGGPVSDAIAISYSMTNDADYDDAPSCITGTPVFDDTMMLAQYSPGKGTGENGNDMGLMAEKMASGSICINELQASNGSFYCDEHGDFDDWVELYNAGDGPVDIGGLYITDDMADPQKWMIPQDDPTATTIPADGYLIVWFDKEAEQGVLHVDAKLSGNGEDVALFGADGKTLIDSVTFGALGENESYGRVTDGNADWRTNAAPTPGVRNDYYENPTVPEYHITCDPDQFRHIYEHYSEDIPIPIELTHASRTWTGAKMRIRGDTSRTFPKKSLRVEFESAPFSNGRDALIFNAEYYDKSYMHQQLSTLLFKAAGYPCASVGYARLFLNGEFLGLYARIESVDGDFLASAGLDPDGDLYKAKETGACLSVYDDVTSHWDKKTNENTGGDGLRTLINGLNTVPDEEYHSFAQAHFDYDRMIDILAINMLITNASTYYHNYYMYQDVNGGGTWTMLPWDLDKTFSSYAWETPYHRSAWSNFRTPDNPFVERAIICQPILGDIRRRIDELHESVFNEEYIRGVVDSLRTLIQPSVAADETDNIESVEEWEKYVGHNVSYVEDRYRFLQRQFSKMPLTFTMIRPERPFHDDVTLRWRPSSDPEGEPITYTLKYGTEFNFPESATTTVTGLTDTTYTLKTTPPEGTYYWIVYACDGTYEVEGFNSRSMFSVSQSSGLPSSLSGDQTLTLAGSPYISEGDVVVEPDAEITVEPGVIIRMADGASIDVYGSFVAAGEPERPVTITSESAMSDWGAICFRETGADSRLSNVVIENAVGHSTDTVCDAVVSSFCSELVLENVRFENVTQAVLSVGCDITLSGCEFAVGRAGEQIRVRDGSALIEHCRVEACESDAIDFEGVTNGTIRDCVINCASDDGIDIGNGSTGIVLDNVRIFDCGDKAVSVGQNSEVSVGRCLIVGAGTGTAVFDGSRVTVDHVTYADNTRSFDLYRSDQGRDGGHAVVKNSILYNCRKDPVRIDSYSDIKPSYCLSDGTLPDGTGNIDGDPKFVDPSNRHYRLLPQSPCIDAGDPGSEADPDGGRSDIGAYPYVKASVIINELNYNSAPDYDSGDWIELFNTETYPVDISGWRIMDSDDNNALRFAEGTVMKAGGYFVIAYDKALFGALFPDVACYDDVMRFGLSGSGDAIRLYDSGMALVDSLAYSDSAPWPVGADGAGHALALINPALDNAVSSHWAASKGYGTPGEINDVYRDLSVENTTVPGPFSLCQNFPNPFNGTTHIPITIHRECHVDVEVYSVLGQKVATLLDDDLSPGDHVVTFDSGSYSNGVYFYRVKAGDYGRTMTMMLLK